MRRLALRPLRLAPRRLATFAAMAAAHPSPAVVLYHCPCNDGAYAALAAALALRASGAAAPRFVAHRVTQALSVEALGLGGEETVYLLDYVGPAGFAEAVARRAKRVVVLDHHKTAAAALPPPASRPPNLDVTLDMDRSGAGLALAHFAPPALPPSVARAFAAVEDGDLWRWRLPDSRAFYAGLGAARIDFDAGANPGVWDELAALDFDAVVAKGRPLLAKQDAAVARFGQDAYPVVLGGVGAGAGAVGAGQSNILPATCLAVDLPTEAAGLRSALGNALAERALEEGRRAIGAVVYREADMAGGDNVKVSLRSVGDEDTTPVSAAHGGGGHQHASSFMVEEAVWRGWRVDE